MTIDHHVTIGPSLQANPFGITKAVDFTDSEIDSTWVDWPAPGGFATFMNVASPMARIIRGGKGTGRTHVMRHFSAPVQAIRGGDNPTEQILKDGVLGIYVLCSGLNSSRFRGRGLDDETWRDIFCQYADVWLAQTALAAFVTASAGQRPSEALQRAITEEVRELFDGPTENSGPSLADLRQDLYTIQRGIDVTINNIAFNPGAKLDITIRSTLGNLVFGVPAALQRHYEPFKDITYLYLIDEFENFDLPQQQYINSLVREKRRGTSFMIGVRTFGLRTLSTLGVGEENRHGSEFEQIRPDRKYVGTDSDKYKDFCHSVVARRLAEYNLLDDATREGMERRLNAFFEVPGPDYEEQLIIKRYSPNERPYVRRLKRQLSSYAKVPGAVPVMPQDVDFVVQATRVPSRPLLEKVNVFLIYRSWADGEDLVRVARDMMDARPSKEPPGVVQPNATQRSVLDHYATDIRAQLCHDMRVGQVYGGIDQFISMSDGLPRNLLVVLKNVYRWALFNGERPFHEGKISIESQRMGVLEATEWFLADASPLGEEGQNVTAAIGRLGEMFRRLRFADKPVESSLASFSADLTDCSMQARRIVDLAEQWALLVSVEGGQKQRNTGLTESKFQLNRLLSPRWDLPTARRGAIGLSADEMNAIFDPAHASHFKGVLRRRLERMTVPFGRGRNRRDLQNAFSFEIEEQEGRHVPQG